MEWSTLPSADFISGVFTRRQTSLMHQWLQAQQSRSSVPPKQPEPALDTWAETALNEQEWDPIEEPLEKVVEPEEPLCSLMEAPCDSFDMSTKSKDPVRKEETGEDKTLDDPYNISVSIKHDH